MIEKLVFRFRGRWYVLVTVSLILIAFAPSPLHRRWVASIRGAQQALNSSRIEDALADIEHAIQAEPAAEHLHMLAGELANFIDDDQRAEYHFRALSLSVDDASTTSCGPVISDSPENYNSDSIGELMQRFEHCPSAYKQARQISLERFKSNPQMDQLERLEQLHRFNSDDIEMHRAYALLLTVGQPLEALDHLRVLSILGEPGSLESDLYLTLRTTLESDSAAYTFAQAGQVFARAGYWRLAQLSFKAALMEEPEYAEALAYYGLAKEQNGLDGSEEIRAAISSSPANPLFHVFLAMHHQKLDHVELAREALDTAARLDPNNPAIAAQLGSVYADIGDFTAATQAFLAATDLAPDDARFWHLLARFSLEYKIDLESLGLPAARNAISTDLTDATGYELLGTIQLELQRYLLAERSLRKSLVIDPLSARAQYAYALLKDQRGQVEPARAAFRAAQILDPEGQYGELAGRILTQTD